MTLRPSFSDPAAIYAYLTEILWDEENRACVSRRAIDAAFSQAGAVAVPNQSGYIYFVTNRNGQYRLVILSRPTISGEMHGIMTTLMSGRGSQLMPVAAPLVLVPPKALGESRSEWSPRATPATRSTGAISGAPSRSRSRFSCRVRRA